MIKLNSANQHLKAIKNRKALLTKEYYESIEYINECYKKDMEILDAEEREWLEQFDDIPPIEDSPVKRYRKKPIIIEAYVTEKEKFIDTPEGTMKASKGDYIITGVKGEKYPCKPDIFHETYEEI